MMNRRIAGVVLALCVALAACGNSESSEDAGPPTSTTGSPPDPTEPVGPPPKVKITPIAQVNRPTAMAVRDGDNSLYVAEKGGVIKTVKGGVVDATPVLDISGETTVEGERGLLGLAFAPDRPVFYINYTDKEGDTRVVEYKLDNGGKADLRSRREVLFVDQPFPNHNGGQLAFGPEGALYISLGDGGSAGDPQKNGQNLSVLLGKILRIRPETPANGLPYTIPFDNPFAKQAGARGEIWSYGLRNPWRFSFDRTKGGMWIADVGQDRREEINFVDKDPKGGQNYGWSLREGTLEKDGPKPSGAVDPIHEYDTTESECSVTGGYVYRGKQIPDMMGRYIFGDYCSGNVSVLTRRGSGWEAEKLEGVKVDELASFGEDHDGEVYTLSLQGQVGRIDRA